ncbi:winged helix-turn-helix domain-containing protein [Streptomyces sp. KR80]|uniref:winged helix-turn-helix domain-containing protein n=1 Tax=Streptomyces sp. KR80 TaxID=3457426 RepID=UPI003FD1EEA5
MPNARSLSSTASVPSPSAPAVRHRLRAVDQDEVVHLSEFLPRGATWLPAPQNTLPILPGQPPMVGYLVLVPADETPADLALAAAAAVGTAEPATVPQDTGPVRVDGTRRTALVDGEPLDLTYLEFELLAHLVAHPHRVHTRDQLVTTVWGYGHVGDGRTVDVHVARLRRKLGPAYRDAIVTVRRVGYKYEPPTA